MSRTITLEIPEETYEAIEMQAETKGVKPAQMIVEWLSEAIRQAQTADEDPLEALIGTLECQVTDVAEWKRQGRRLVTTNYVLAELISLFISPLCVPRPAQFRYIDTIKAVPYVKVVHVDPALDAVSWALLKSRPDKEWALVDAASFTLMQERGISEALTTDHHFEQAGFVRLLKP